MPRPQAAPSRRRATGPDASALRKKGVALLDRGRISDAIEVLERALKLAPADVPTLFHLGSAAQRLGLHDGAIRLYDHVLSLEPERIEAAVNRSNAHRSAGRPDLAADQLRAALASHAEEPTLWQSLGNALRDQGLRDEAAHAFAEAIRLDPDYGAALASRADLTIEEGQCDAALADYHAALKANPRHPQIRLARALALLQTGALDEGWREYGWRFKAASQPVTTTHRLKGWSGQPLKGRNLLVSGEQGIGDQIMFAALLPMVIERARQEGIALHLECEPRLVSLLTRSFPDVTVHAWTIDETATPWRSTHDWMRPEHRLHWAVPMGDLAKVFWPNAPAPAREEPWLHTDETQQDRWAGWLNALDPKRSTGPRIGLCWRSGKQTGLRQHAYAPLEVWLDLATELTARDRPPVQLICTQYDASDEERRAFQDRGVTLHHPPDLDQKADIDGACALIANLDLVISAPTAVAYQAAVLGVPVFRMMPFAHWTTLGGPKDAFAPRIRDFITTPVGNWQGAFQALRTQIDPFCTGRSECT